MAGFYDFRFGKSIVGEDAPKYGGKCMQDFFAEDDFVKYGRGGLSQNMIVMLPVEEYVALCEPLKADDHKHHADLKKKLDSGEIQRFDSIPLLRIRQMEDGTDAKVYGHDGRHRAMLMKELGFDKIPVRLYAENFCWGENCGDGSRIDSAEILQYPGAGLRGWPKWLWGQNDKAMDTDKAKFKFPVKREDSGRAFDRGALMERATNGLASAMDGGRKVYRDELGRLIGTAQMECGVLVFRDAMGRRMASAAFDGCASEEE